MEKRMAKENLFHLMESIQNLGLIKMESLLRELSQISKWNYSGGQFFKKWIRRIGKTIFPKQTKQLHEPTEEGVYVNGFLKLMEFVLIQTGQDMRENLETVSVTDTENFI